MSDTRATDISPSHPVELGDMSTFPLDQEQQAVAGAFPSSAQQEQSQTHSSALAAVSRPLEDTAPSAHIEASSSSLPPPITLPSAALTRTETGVIGPPTDLPTPMLAAPTAAGGRGLVLQFTLLLASTGTRHPYQINERYLNKRNVKAEGQDGTFDPALISIYTLKELIWKDWREDWDTKPSSPSAIRLIYFGRLLDDKQNLKDSRLNTEGSPNVLHVSIKPQDIVEDEDAVKGGKASSSRDRDGAERTPGCRCVIL